MGRACATRLRYIFFAKDYGKRESINTAERKRGKSRGSRRGKGGKHTPVERECITRPRAKREVLIFFASENRVSDSNAARSSPCYIG
jgi:hypothetical protein